MVTLTTKLKRFSVTHAADALDSCSSNPSHRIAVVAETAMATAPIQPMAVVESKTGRVVVFFSAAGKLVESEIG